MIQARINCRVYYEDTDAAGVVYYANYLKYLERGRTEFLRTLGLVQADLARQYSIVFAVKDLKIDYLLPARLDDMLQVETAIDKLGKASIKFRQNILHDDKITTTAMAGVVCLHTTTFKPCRIPKPILEKIP